MEPSTLNEAELLFDELERVAEEYCKNAQAEKNRQALVKFLQNNDCREMIAKCVDGDSFSSAFVGACSRNHPDIFQAFLDQGMNADIMDHNGSTALIEASTNVREESVQLLLNHNSRPNVQNRSGWTALMWASCFGSKNIVQLLLNYGADIDLKNKEGYTALDFARTQEIKDMIQNHVNTSYVLK